MSTPGRPLQVRAYAGSDVGRVRKGNEDNALVGRSVFAVADGMGGHVAGEVASETALEPLKELDGITFKGEKRAREALVEAVVTANTIVAEKAQADPAFRGMGTTLTAALVLDGKLHVAHVGDSRAYLLRSGDRVVQLTTDHTLVEQLVQEGRLSRDEAATHPQRSVITRAIGIDATVEVDVLPALALQPDDQVLLCSDGLTGPVSDEDISAVLTGTDDGDAACQALIDAANAAGGPDNITVVLLRLGGDAPAPPSADTGGETPTEDLSQVAAAARAVADGDDGDDVRRISTREETGRDWATSMGQYGAPQGSPQRGAPQATRSGRGARAAAVGLAVLVILGLLGAGGYVLFSGAWFVGDDDGAVAVFRGLPSEVGGMRLARVEERSTIAVDDLTPRRAERVRQGVTFASREEADEFVEALREDVDADAETDADDTSSPGGDSEAGGAGGLP